jgi:hypothetical protein
MTVVFSGLRETLGIFNRKRTIIVKYGLTLPDIIPKAEIIQN